MAKQNGKAATVERPAGAGRSRVELRLEEWFDEQPKLPLGEHRGRWRGHRVQVKQADGSTVKIATKASAGQEWRPCVVRVEPESAIEKSSVCVVPPARKVAPKQPVAKRKVAATLNGVKRETPIKAASRPADARAATAPVNTGSSGPFASTPGQSAQDLALHALSLLTTEHFPGCSCLVNYSTCIRELAMRGRAGDRDGVLELVRSVPAVGRCVFGG